jgi:type IV pilus assembly protein PilM
MANYLLGVDLGASNIKVLEIKDKKESLIVKNILTANAPESSVVDGAVLDHEAVAKVVDELVSPVKGMNKESALGLRGRDVVVKRLSIPWNGKGNFQEVFLWSAEQYIGMKSENISVDAQLLSHNSETGVADVVVGAAVKDKVADCISAARQSGVTPVVVDIEALALVNLYTRMKGRQDHVNAIIDMGHDSTRVVFFENGYVDSVKDLPKGGKYLMEDMAQDMDIDIDKASVMVRDKKIMETDADAQAGAMAFGSSLGAELETTIDVYMEDRGKEPVDFFVCGAGAYIPGVVEQIEISMGVSIDILDPFSFIELPDNFKSVVDTIGGGAFAVAAGLALRSL